MRVALTIYDDNGSVEVASVDCNSFVGGCSELGSHMSAALWRLSRATQDSTASREELGLTGHLLTLLEDMGRLEDLPVPHSC